MTVSNLYLVFTVEELAKRKVKELDDKFEPLFERKTIKRDQLNFYVQLKWTICF